MNGYICHTLRNILSLSDIITFVSPAKNKHGWIIYPTIALEGLRYIQLNKILTCIR